MNAATKDILYSSHPGDVIGPFQDENYMCLFKVLSKDTIYKMRVSHIYISWKAHNNDTSTVMSLAESFLQRVKSGEDYNELARLEGEVSSGDLGWFNSGVMVKPFEDAIMKAQKGDLFIVQTIFGAHVVLVTENKEFEDYKFTVVPFIKKL
ncbi:MAG: peptidylprolyl isomerase [Cytophagaceae bacterium]